MNTITEQQLNTSKQSGAVSSCAYVKVTLADGSDKLMTLSAFAALISNTGDSLAVNRNSMDGCFILYKHGTDTYHCLACWDQWGSLKSTYTADGVLVISGGKCIVVAPTQGSAVNWAATNTAAVTGNATTSKPIALERFDGKTATETAYSALGASNADGKAIGFAHSYSHGSIAAGSWWLPSLGELVIMFANKHRINKCLSVIDGADQIPDSAHWSSTEYSATHAWGVNFGSGIVNGSSKVSSSCVVRPVAAWPV